MKITAAASYAVTAVVYIANATSGQPVANSEISRTHKLPERFLIQILRHLVNGDVLTSVRGLYGGYKLAKPASKITLLEIIVAVDRPLGYGFDDDLALAPTANAAVRGDRGRRSQAASGHHNRGPAGGEGGVRVEESLSRMPRE